MDTNSICQMIKIININFLRYLRFSPFDKTSQDGRADERIRLASLSVLANFFSKVFGVILMLMSVRLTLPYLGVERFGIWMTISSFVALLTFLDFGVGNTLTNEVAKKSVMDDKKELVDVITLGLLVLLAISFLITFSLILVFSLISWGWLVKVTDLSLLDEAKNTSFVFSCLFGLYIFMTGVQRVFNGMQKSYIVHIASSVGYIFSCFGLWYATKNNAGIPCLMFIVFGGQSFSTIPLLIILISKKFISFSSIKKIKFNNILKILKVSVLFLLLQIGTMIGWGADSLIISSNLSVKDVAVFNVTLRLFQLITQPLGIFNSPLWAAYADAHSRSDIDFIKKTLKKSLFFTFIFSFFVGLFLIFFGGSLISLWTTGMVNVSTIFIFIFFLWVLIECMGSAFSMMLNGCGVVAPQIRAVLLFILIALPVKIIAVRYGLEIFMLATIVCYLIAVPIYYYFYERNIILKKIGF
jgi:O-antigen/teichoic acid export membrane protein